MRAYNIICNNCCTNITLQNKKGTLEPLRIAIPNIALGRNVTHNRWSLCCLSLGNNPFLQTWWLFFICGFCRFLWTTFPTCKISCLLLGGNSRFGFSSILSVLYSITGITKFTSRSPPRFFKPGEFPGRCFFPKISHSKRSNQVLQGMNMHK